MSRVLLTFALLLSGCQPAASSQPPPPQVQALIERSIAQMVFVEGGSFMLGDGGTYISEESYRRGWEYEVVDPGHPGAVHIPWTWQDNNKPPVEVTLSSYHISKYETTYGEYDLFTETTGRPYIINPEREANRPSRAPDQPAAVNWYGADAYCRWLAELSGLPFALPTEAQWEYAARSRGRNVGYATDTGLFEVGRNIGDYIRMPHPVGAFPPNPLGLHDMMGNVREWVSDWYEPGYDHVAGQTDPTGPETGNEKVLRGGSYTNDPAANTVYGRAHRAPDTTNIGLAVGFRCALHLDQPVSLEEVRARWQQP
jgi:formylglycine-generating enzyme